MTDTSPDAPIDYDSLEHLEKKHERIFVVDWCLSNVCNYACSYCPENLHDHSHPFPDLDATIRFGKKLREHISDREIFFQFTGGEVTLWQEMPKLLFALKELNCKVGIITNASRSLDWWKKHVSAIDHICASFHPESARIEPFAANVEFLSKHTTVHCNMMMAPKHFDACLEAAKTLIKIPDVTVALQPLLIEFKDTFHDYTPEQMKVIHEQYQVLGPARYTKERYSYRGLMAVRKDGQELDRLPSHVLIAKKMNRWKDWECSAGIEQLVVDFQGDIYRGWCTEGGRIGNIKDWNLKLPNKAITCQRGFCHCNLDVMTKKSRQNKELLTT